MKKLIVLFVAMLWAAPLVYAGLDCDNLTPCKYTRAGTECENAECPALLVYLNQPQTLQLVVALYAQPMCQGSGQSFEYTVPLPEGFTVLYMPVPNCPEGLPYSADVRVNQCDIICADFICGDPDTPVNCDAENKELPAINIPDLR